MPETPSPEDRPERLAEDDPRLEAAAEEAIEPDPRLEAATDEATEPDPRLEAATEEATEPQVDGEEEGAPEPQLDPEVEARRVAAMSFVRKLGDPILKSRATPVDRFDEALRAQIERMAGIMSDALGVGLAAPQLGISQRVLVYRLGREAPMIALANPEVEWTSEASEEFEEGCLSIPGVHVDVERPVHVRVRARDEEGEERLIEASGLEARVIQHEIDHLDGLLTLDRTTREQRKEAMRQLREAERADEAA